MSRLLNLQFAKLYRYFIAAILMFLIANKITNFLQTKQRKCMKTFPLELDNSHWYIYLPIPYFFQQNINVSFIPNKRRVLFIDECNVQYNCKWPSRLRFIVYVLRKKSALENVRCQGTIKAIAVIKPHRPRTIIQHDFFSFTYRCTIFCPAFKCKFHRAKIATLSEIGEG